LAACTESSLMMSNVQPAQAGTYYVLITNSAGNATSMVATLTVDAPPSILTQPQDQTVTVGQDASFTVAATGIHGLSYQWQVNGAALPGAIATGPTLMLTNVQENMAGDYTVFVSNDIGSVTSVVAKLIVNVPLKITTQPQSQMIMQGQSATFTVAASGTAPLDYQWNFNGAPLAGATNSVLTLTNAQTNAAGNYNAVVT